MKADRPFFTLRASVTTTTSPQAVYDVLADLQSHLEWGGRRAVSKRLKLRTLDAPSGPAVVGTRFSSTGPASMLGKDTFHDSSVVVEAEPGRRFGFDTESTLERKHRPPTRQRCTHRYTIEPREGGARIAYVFEYRAEGAHPYWFSPLMRPGTHAMVGRLMASNLRTWRAWRSPSRRAAACEEPDRDRREGRRVARIDPAIAARGAGPSRGRTGARRGPRRPGSCQRPWTSPAAGPSRRTT